MDEKEGKVYPDFCKEEILIPILDSIDVIQFTKSQGPI